MSQFFRKEHTMEKAQKNPVNRCFGSNCPQKPQQQRKEQIEDLLKEAAQRKKANKELDFLLRQFHGRKSILQLLPVIKLRCSDVVLAVALERVERRRNGLAIDDLVFLETFKKSLQNKQG